MGIKRYLSNILRHDRNMRDALEQIRQHQEQTDVLILDSVLKLRIENLRQHIMHCEKSGITSDKLCDEEVIVSLTSFGKRIYDVCLAIESIMQGSIKPNRIILWLAEDEFSGKPLPSTLIRQQQRGLEISFCKDIRSYNKLIYTLQQNPEACIITIDDDAIYEFDIVERLINAHKEQPGTICACRVHRITLYPNGQPKSYLDWEHCIATTDPTPLNFATGCGGILYPPHSLHPEVVKEEIFTRLCPKADDIWFYAMARLQNTNITHVYTPNPTSYYCGLPTQEIDALNQTNTNVENCENDKQFEAVSAYYCLFSGKKR